jgi:hypothetical protein
MVRVERHITMEYVFRDQFLMSSRLTTMKS